MSAGAITSGTEDVVESCTSVASVGGGTKVRTGDTEAQAASKNIRTSGSPPRTRTGYRRPHRLHLFGLQESPGVIPRYTLPDMAAIWSDQHRLELWQRVEGLALEGWEALNMVPAGVGRAVLDATTPTPAQVRAREEVTNHDLAAFVDVLADAVPHGSEWVHFGLTSSDVLDTAGGVMLVEAADLLLSDVRHLFDAVKSRALQHRGTAMIGRTHGIWAEPTSFGLKLATWAFEAARGHARLAAARQRVAVGKISGAVGTYAHCPPSIERHVCTALGLEPEPASTQIVQRDRHAEFLAVLALIGASVERFATEIRHLQRSEVGEAREAFRPGQKGSSAMPHKRNPIVSERMTGMARLLRGYAVTGLENVALWHERDISHSSAERVVLPDACLTLHYMLVTFTRLVEHLVVDADRMAENLTATNGLIASQAVLLELVGDGMSRDDAYRVVQRNALRSWDEGSPLLELLDADPEVSLSREALSDLLAPARFLRETGVVFQRLAELEI